MKLIVKYLLFITLLFVVSCSEDTLDPEIRGTITGIVKDKDTNEPLAGVLVRTNPTTTTATSADDGTFILSQILIDDYSVQAELDEYVTGFEPALVTENSVSEIVILLTKNSGENDPPTIPELIFPEDGSQNIGLEVEFLWDSEDAEDDEITYLLQLRNGLTQEIQEFEVVQDTSFTVSNLMLATNYFWEVTADDGENTPVTSSISEFTTLTQPDNPFFFTRIVNGNNIIFSGNEDIGNNPEVNINTLQLTNNENNSFKPRKNATVNKLAYLRSVGGDTHLFTMNLDGTNKQQVTNTAPVGGFRIEEIGFTWAQDGGSIYYPSFDKLYRINTDGSSRTLVYQTTDGSLISEVEIPQFDENILLLKTNNLEGYDVRIFTYDLSTETEEAVILEGQEGAALSIDISADGNRVLYSRDITESENPNYRIFNARMFLYDITLDSLEPIQTEVITGQNEYHCRLSPTEGGVVFTRVNNNTGAVPSVYSILFTNNENDRKIFEPGFFPDWE